MHTIALALGASLLAGACSPSSEAESGPQAPVPEPPALVFEDVTSAWGLDFVHDAGMTPEKHLPETMGAGAALIDVDSDGDLDLYLVQGGPLPFAASARSDAPTNRLYLNDGNGRLRDATASSGDAAHGGYGMGVSAGDVDGDGTLDLYVTNLGPDVLLLGDGRGGFEDATARAGLGDPRWNTSATFFDADRDGDLDLYVCGYVHVDLAAPVWCGKREPGWRSYCHPDQFEGIGDRFYSNDGSGRFEDRTESAGLTDSAGKGLGVIACDLDGDGLLDLYVANDSVENRMWRGLGDGRFEDATLLSATGVNGAGSTEAGMGVAAGDVDGDGHVDLFVTNFDDESNTLYKSDGGGLFSDVTAQAGLDGPSRLPVGFGAVLEDLDNDGDLDLVVANGHILDNIHLYHDGKSWRQRIQLYANRGGGRFDERTDASGDLGATAFVGRGLYSGDLDGDGRPDLVLTECDGAARIFKSVGAAADALELCGLPQGARVRARFDDGSLAVRDAIGSSSYLGTGPGRVHLGLAGHRLEALSVSLPRGITLPVEPLPSQARVDLRLNANGSAFVPED